jgi:hypothetical protein
MIQNLVTHALGSGSCRWALQSTRDLQMPRDLFKKAAMHVELWLQWNQKLESLAQPSRGCFGADDRAIKRSWISVGWIVDLMQPASRLSRLAHPKEYTYVIASGRLLARLNFSKGTDRSLASRPGARKRYRRRQTNQLEERQWILARA